MTDHLEKSATAVVILVVHLEVLGEAVDAIGEYRDLNLRRAGVALVSLVLVNNCLLLILKHWFFTFLFLFGAISGGGG